MVEGFFITKNELVTFSVAEQLIIEMEMVNLDDESLVDEVMALFSKCDVLPEVEDSVNLFFRTGKLSSTERKILEGIYKLYHSKSVVSE